MHKIKIAGFTIMEILIVCVILGVVAALGIPQYSKTIEQTRVSDGKMQLKTIHGANKIYYAKTGAYWPASGTNDLNTINSTLGLNIIANGLTYTCSVGAGPAGTTFECTAVRTSPAYTITITQADLNDTTNPVCSGTCP